MFKSAPARAPAPAPAHHAPAPATQHHAPPPAAPMTAAPPARSGGLGSTIMEGMAFGAGSAIAHRAVGAIAGSLFGGSSDREAAPAPAAAGGAPDASVGAPASLADPYSRKSGADDCASMQREFTRCLADNRDSISMCQGLLDSYEQCRRDNRLA